ncbi:hypothetical protein L7F22_033967 [Adiantum nelumboides]|nr:hypothetical protein [Adiantum nelumboides]
MFHSVALPLHFADKVPLTLIQLGQTSKDKAWNLEHARRTVIEAVQKDKSRKPRMVVLPECWNSPYGVQYFDTYAEDFGGAYEAVKAPLSGERIDAAPAIEASSEEKQVAEQQQQAFEKRWTIDGIKPIDVSNSPSETVKMMAGLAKELDIVLVGGSIPERDAKTGKLYNTATVFDETGRLISMHRKLHLFDIDIPGKMTFQESKTLTAGDRITVFECSLGRFGLAICYDLRFPKLPRWPRGSARAPSSTPAPSTPRPVRGPGSCSSEGAQPTTRSTSSPARRQTLGR